MNEIVDSDRTSDPAHRRERGIEAYARIFDVTEKDVPAATAGPVSQVFADAAFLAPAVSGVVLPGAHRPRTKHADHRRARRPGRRR